LSFFDDDGEETAQQPAARLAQPRRPRPRSPGAGGGPGGPDGPDEHTLIVRRRVALGGLVALLIVIVLVVSSCVKGEKTQALKNYNQSVSQIARESGEQVATPLFTTLASASSKQALEVEEQVDQLRIQAQGFASRVQGLSVPSEMEGAQRNLLLAYNLRAEAIGKLTTLLPKALGGKDKQSIEYIAGAMEIFLASDVLYSQRVAPLIQQTLSEHGVHGITTSPSRFLPNLGWLEPNTVSSRLTGTTAAGQPTTGGTHGSSLKGVSVGSTELAAEPTLNHLSGGGSPTFSVSVENAGESTSTNVKVTVTVSAGGKQYKSSGTIEKLEAGKTSPAQVTVTGIPTGAASKVEVSVEAVPGETNLENNKGSFLAIFE
jgi:uncharacterized repeat protein (TIGR01451 family)